jgi:putative addiction module component (TIGR02574 family)
MESDEEPSALEYEPADIEAQDDVEDAWYREIERRAAELDSGAAETIPWETVRARLRANPAHESRACFNSHLCIL